MEITLRSARRLADKTQGEVANYIGVCLDTYRSIERHPERATIKQAKAISNFLGMPYGKIFFGE